MEPAAPSIHEMIARDVKVSKMVATMHDNGWDSLIILNAMRPVHWDAVDRAAGVKRSSETTRQMVADRIRQMRRPRCRPAV